VILAPGKNLPFQRGKTLYETESPGTQPNILGQLYAFEGLPVDKLQAAGQPAVGLGLGARVCLNASGIALKPGRIATWKNDATNPFGTAVGGYAFASTDFVAGVIDEFLPAAGVQPGDIFWLIQFGLTKVRTPGTLPANIAIGDPLIPGVGTSGTNDDAGRVIRVTGTLDTIAESLSYAGRAQEAVTTADTLFRAFVNTLTNMR
jgi:hypothetical protein